MASLTKLKQTLREHQDSETAKILQRFFKTGAGEYGEGDKFLGIKVPMLRSIAKQFLELNLTDLNKLIASAWHEDRLVALLILVELYKKNHSQESKEEIYKFYTGRMQYINNWDLVDLTAPHIVGHYLYNNLDNKNILIEWAQAELLWARRIAIVATHYFIRNHKFDATLRIANLLLEDEEDLIHKAVGWMLREVGKRDVVAEERFLRKCYKKMPRTMLRYAIERFPEKKRQQYLKGEI